MHPRCACPLFVAVVRLPAMEKRSTRLNIASERMLVDRACPLPVLPGCTMRAFVASLFYGQAPPAGVNRVRRRRPNPSDHPPGCFNRVRTSVATFFCCRAGAGPQQRPLPKCAHCHGGHTDANCFQMHSDIRPLPRPAR